MSDELLKALGKVGRDERAAADAEMKDAPVLDDVARERLVKAALDELGTRRPRARRVAILAAIVLAAAIALFVGLRKNTLPPYVLSVQGGTSEWRGEDAGPRDRIAVRGDGALEIVMRPDEPVNRPLQARAFATRAGVERSLPVEISKQGVVRVAGRADELFGPASGPVPDEWRVSVIVGEGGDVRRAETIVVVSASTSTP